MLRALGAGTPWAPAVDGPEPVDLLRTLEREGLLPHCADLEVGDNPPSWWARVEDASRVAAQRNLAGLATLAVLSREFAREGIAHLAFKGPVSNHALYGTRARRIYGDVDILVRRRDHDRATAAMVALSFRSSSAGTASLAGRLHFHSNFGVPEGKGLLPVELHWELIDRVNLLRIDLDEIFVAAEHQAVAGVQVPVLDPSAHLVYLCCHLLKHGSLVRQGLRSGKPAEWFARGERGFPLAWLVDLHHAFLMTAGLQRSERVRRLIREWNAAEEVETCVALLDLLLPSPRRTAAIAQLGLALGDGTTPSRSAQRAPGSGGRLVEKVTGRLITRGLRFSGTWSFRPIRFLDLPRVLVPSPRRLRAFHGDFASSLPRLYARHAFMMVRRLFALRSPSR